MLSRHLLQNLLHKIHKRRGKSRWFLSTMETRYAEEKKKRRKLEIPKNMFKKQYRYVKVHKLCTKFSKALRKTCWACQPKNACTCMTICSLNKKKKNPKSCSKLQYQNNAFINKCNSPSFSGNTAVPFQSNASPCYSTTPYILSTINNEILNRHTLPQMHNTQK